jgi:cell division GTPase FtsZ
VLGEDISMIAAFKTADNVLRNAVGGIAEIINVPGLVNVDFEDVRTVMGEMGKAMMGSAAASGMDRARLAAEQAVASPLLEGIELSGARGVLVNISANSALGMKEVREVMNTIRAYAADDAHIIFGTVFDDAMEDNLRVTVVATGLGAAAAAQQPAAHGSGGAEDRHGQRADRRDHQLRRAGGAGGDAQRPPQRHGGSDGGQRGGQARHSRLPAQAGRLMARRIGAAAFAGRRGCHAMVNFASLS